MSRILLADDSPHAQRMGERILRDEGFEVVSVTDGDTALLRLSDVDPDVVVADVLLPGKSGYEICEYIKSQPRHRHIRVLLTAGLLEPYDPERARAVSSDGAIRKPFEASAMLAAIKPQAEVAGLTRAVPAPEPKPPEIDPELVRAAVTVALDRAMPAIVEEITQHIVEKLQSHAR